MFYEDKGTWLIMFFTTIMSTFFGSLLYNTLVLLAVDSAHHSEVLLNDNLSMRNETFTRGAATGTWFGDSLTAAMVIDMMLQDSSQYRQINSLAKMRNWWRNACNGMARIIIFWITLLGFTSAVVTIIFTHVVEWDDITSSVVLPLSV